MSAKIHSTEMALAGRMDTGGSGICGRPEARIAKASGVAAPVPALPCSPDTGRGTASPFRASDQSPADLDPARTAFDGLLCRTHYRQRADEVPGACHNKDKAWTILVPGIASSTLAPGLLPSRELKVNHPLRPSSWKLLSSGYPCPDIPG